MLAEIETANVCCPSWTTGAGISALKPILVVSLSIVMILRTNDIVSIVRSKSRHQKSIGKTFEKFCYICFSGAVHVGSNDQLLQAVKIAVLSIDPFQIGGTKH